MTFQATQVVNDLYLYNYIYHLYLYNYLYLYKYLYICMCIQIYTYMNIHTVHTLHGITLHYITSHYITLYHITLHYITLYYIYTCMNIYIYMYLTYRKPIYQPYDNQKVCNSYGDPPKSHVTHLASPNARWNTWSTASIHRLSLDRRNQRKDQGKS